MNLCYEKIESQNLELKSLYKNHYSNYSLFKKEIFQKLKEYKFIKTIIVCFSDLEGKLHNLNYDKEFIMNNDEFLTFDGSSVKGFSSQDKSDLILKIDWSSFYFLPADVFCDGKCLVFANVIERNGSKYCSDFRGRLQEFLHELNLKQKITFNIAPEIEGFLFNGINAEQNFCENKGFELISNGSYCSSSSENLFGNILDKIFKVLKALGFEVEKNHAEVAPSQFELNYKYCDPIQACDKIHLYKMICRCIANQFGHTASFLPKPIVGANGTGMHINLSMKKNDKNIFYDQELGGFSEFGMDFAKKILDHAKEICLIINSSVNSYRRLDPLFEAPNEIKISSCDRGSMIRIPYASSESSTRFEIRSVAPDCNSYLSIFAILNLGLMNYEECVNDKRQNDDKKIEKLPSSIHESINFFEKSLKMKDILGNEAYEKFLELKKTIANRSPKELGKMIKKNEIIHHHEVTNQLLWNKF